MAFCCHSANILAQHGGLQLAKCYLHVVNLKTHPTSLAVFLLFTFAFPSHTVCLNFILPNLFPPHSPVPISAMNTHSLAQLRNYRHAGVWFDVIWHPPFKTQVYWPFVALIWAPSQILFIFHWQWHFCQEGEFWMCLPSGEITHALYLQCQLGCVFSPHEPWNQHGPVFCHPVAHQPH